MKKKLPFISMVIEMIIILSLRFIFFLMMLKVSWVYKILQWFMKKRTSCLSYIEKRYFNSGVFKIIIKYSFWLGVVKMEQIDNLIMGNLNMFSLLSVFLSFCSKTRNHQIMMIWTSFGDCILLRHLRIIIDLIFD